MPTTESNQSWQTVLWHDAEDNHCVEFRDCRSSRVVLRVRYAKLPGKTAQQVRKVMLKAMDNMYGVREDDIDSGSMVSFGKRVLHGCVQDNYAVKEKADSNTTSKSLREQDMRGAVDAAGRIATKLFDTWPDFDRVATHVACAKGGRPGTFSGSRNLTNGDHCDLKVRTTGQHAVKFARLSDYSLTHDSSKTRRVLSHGCMRVVGRQQELCCVGCPYHTSRRPVHRRMPFARLVVPRGGVRLGGAAGRRRDAILGRVPGCPLFRIGARARGTASVPLHCRPKR